jgi:TonB family protein
MTSLNMKSNLLPLLALGVCTAFVSATSLRAEDACIHVTEGDLLKAAVNKVQPEYPRMARQLRLAGRALIEVFVDTQGEVEKAEPISGNPVLTGAAAAALKKWKFTPFKFDGKLTRVTGVVAFDFHP